MISFLLIFLLTGRVDLAVLGWCSLLIIRHNNALAVSGLRQLCLLVGIAGLFSAYGLWLTRLSIHPLIPFASACLATWLVNSYRAEVLPDTLRRLQWRDMGQLMALHREIFKRGELSVMLYLLTGNAVGIFQGKRLVAYLCSHRLPLCQWIEWIGVTHRQRGKGLGDRLMASLGGQALALAVSVNNTTAIRLYDKYELRIKHTLTDYFGRGKHALLMVR